MAAAASPGGRWDPAGRYHHEVWDQGAGFSAGSINAIVQARDGYLWIGARDGLYRFDGVRFKHFNRRNTPEFRDQEVLALAADEEGLWIGTGVGGLIRYRGGVFRLYQRSDGLPDNHIPCLALRGGKLWIGTHNGVAVFDGGHFTRVLEEKVSGMVTALESDHDGNLWIGTRSEVVRVAGEQVTAYDLPDASELMLIHTGGRGRVWVASHERIYEQQDRGLAPVRAPALATNEYLALLRDRRGGLWLAPVTGGLRRFDQDAPGRANELAPNSDEFSVLLEDREGVIWAGTRTGKLHRFREQPFVTLGRRDGLNSDYIYSIYEDKKGVLWVGTPNGLNRIQDGRITVFTMQDGLPHDHVNAISGAGENALWVGTNAGVSRFENGRFRQAYSASDGLSSNYVRVVFEDSRGDLWVGTQHSGLDALTKGRWRHYGIGNGLAGDSVREIHEDARGAVWVGTGRGLTRFDHGRATIYTEREGLRHDSTPVLCEDDRNALWIGTPAGLAWFRNGRFTTFGAEIGITGEVTQVLFDAQESVWVGSEDGIARLRRADLEAFVAGTITEVPVERFGVTDGLATLECSVSTHPLCLRGRDGRLWFATTKGLAMVDPARWPAVSAPPRVHIERMLVNGREAAARDGVELAPGSKELEFQYTMPSLLDAAKVRFRYKLEGVDSEWVNAETRRSAYYSNIGPGRYQFRVTASNSAGVWNERGTTIAFSVAPYWHQTWWFYTGCVVFAAMLLGGGYALRVRQVRRRERELARLVDERTRDLQAAEAQARKAWAAANDASRAKSEFVANMSHEFRTPMNGVLGATELLGSTRLAHDQQEYVAMIRGSAESLLGLLNDVLDFSKIEAGKLELVAEAFDLRTAVEDTMRILSIQAHQKGLELVCDVGAAAPAGVVGDASRLRQVIVNLVGNALKFTERGEVVLRVERDAGPAESEAILHFSVTDTGIGIPPGRLDAIFDAFTQVDSSVARKHDGTGLGLTISRRLVEMMQGRLWVESDCGKGSIFHFTARMPVADVPGPDLPGCAAEIVGGASTLVVDDNATNRRVLEDMLRRCGGHVETVPSAAAALARLEKAAAERTGFDLILLDRLMPETDGFGLAEQLQDRSEIVGAKIIMLTSTTCEPRDFERCRQLGIAAYLMKPIRQAELLEAIARVLGKASAETLEPGAASKGPSCERKLCILLAEDNLVNQKVATRMLETDGHEVTVVANGKLAVEAIERGRFDLVLMDLHMPEMDGLEATRLIRAKQRRSQQHVRIIAMTAAVMSEDRARCLDAGMDGYIAKPINRRDLRATLNRVACEAPIEAGIRAS